MRKLDYETVLRNPHLLREIEQAARRERVAAIGEFFARLFQAPVKKEVRGAVGPRLAH